MKKELLACIALAGGVSGCAQPEAQFCSDLPSAEERLRLSAEAQAPDTDPSTRVFAQRVVTQFCLYQAARNYAEATDRAETIARAAAIRCEAEIANLVAAQYAADEAAGGRPPMRSPVTGQETTLEAHFSGWAERYALVQVVEARSGGCRPIA